MPFFLLINVEMPTIGILTIMSRENFMSSMIFFITSGPDLKFSKEGISYSSSYLFLPFTSYLQNGLVDSVPK